ncbi:hypothetical protein AADZ91_17670 [Colwelliaceae bacterium 6441]
MLAFHIIAGTIVFISGIGALTFSKGGKLHRVTGNVFFFALLLMAGSAAFLADDPTIAFSSIYFASTAWVVILKPEKTIGIFEALAFLAISLICTRYFYIAFTSEPGFMTTMFTIFGGVAFIAALLDLTMIIRGGVSGSHRIARHLWRMCYAMLGAVLSFVAITSDKWSAYIPENLPIYLMIIIMFYWLIKVLFTKWFVNAQHAIGKNDSLFKLSRKKA